MLISEIDFNQVPADTTSIFNTLYEKKNSGYIIRNFFSAEETAGLKKIFRDFQKPVFKPYDGFLSLPRPFNLIKDEPLEDYLTEAQYTHDSLKNSGIWQLFHDKMRRLAGETSVTYASPAEEGNFSKTWASIRELEIGKGYFELHCGRLFHSWNTEFYSHFSKVADINMHLSFFIMLQKPEIDCDIEVLDAHWSEINDKDTNQVLKRVDGSSVAVDTIPSYHVNLREGDMFMFDEGNYWHQVPQFLGSTSRMTFGGFITKFKHEEKVMMWA